MFKYFGLFSLLITASLFMPPALAQQDPGRPPNAFDNQSSANVINLNSIPIITITNPVNGQNVSSPMNVAFTITSQNNIVACSYQIDDHVLVSIPNCVVGNNTTSINLDNTQSSCPSGTYCLLTIYVWDNTNQAASSASVGFRRQ